MTRTWPVLVTSLLALFSSAALNYAVAERDCTSENMTCTGNCSRMIPDYYGMREGCMSNCRNDKWNCDAQNYWERQRAEQARIEELRRQAEAARASMSEEERQRRSLERERAFVPRPRQW
jgi:hypothetical protein